MVTHNLSDTVRCYLQSLDPLTLCRGVTTSEVAQSIYGKVNRSLQVRIANALIECGWSAQSRQSLQRRYLPVAAVAFTQRAALQRCIDLAGGLSALAARANLCANLSPHPLSHRTIKAWTSFGGRVRHEWVVPLCQAVDWQVTPHQLRPDLYPDPAWRP